MKREKIKAETTPEEHLAIALSLARMNSPGITSIVKRLDMIAHHIQGAMRGLSPDVKRSSGVRLLSKKK